MIATDPFAHGSIHVFDVAKPAKPKKHQRSRGTTIRRSRLHSMAETKLDPRDDEHLHRLIAGSSGVPAVRALAEKPVALNAEDKSRIFMAAATAIIKDTGGKGLLQLRRMSNRRRLPLFTGQKQ